METREMGACVANVERATLSAWRDAMLPPAEMERMHEHVMHCTTCQVRLAQYDEVARTLQRQRELEPGDRVVEAVRRNLAHHPPRRWTPSRRAWGSLSALASVAAVILLFVYVLETGPLGHPRPRGEATVVPTVTPAPTPTPPPTIGPTTFTPAVPLQDAWGPGTATAQLSTQLDATHVFSATSATADGHMLFGSMTVLDAGRRTPSTEQAGILDVLTGQFTPVGDRLTEDPVTFPFPSAFCLSSDGSYVICTDELGPAGPDDPPGPITVWSYDLASGQTHRVTDSSRYPLANSESSVLISRGLLILSGGSQLGLVSLATDTLSLLSLPVHSPFAMEFSWPYLVYADTSLPSGPMTVRAHDLATSEDVALPQVDALYAATNNAGANHQPSLALAGDTLFVSLMTGRIQSSNIPPNNVTGPDAATTLYEMDRMLSSDAQLRPVARYHGVAGYPAGANDRLVAFDSVAWDRAEDRFVEYSSLPDGQGPLAALTGNALMLRQTLTPPAIAEQVTVYDTARLHTAGS